MRHNKLPRPHEYVRIVDNASLRVISSGYLVHFSRDCICIETGEGLRRFDAKIHHFEGYKPDKLLIK